MRRVNRRILDVGTQCLVKLALIFLYNFHHDHSLLKLQTKKLSPKINVKNIKKSSLTSFLFTADLCILPNVLSWFTNILI